MSYLAAVEIDFRNLIHAFARKPGSRHVCDPVARLESLRLIFEHDPSRKARHSQRRLSASQYRCNHRDVQAENFRAHIRGARLAGVPLAIHARDADDDIALILRQERERGGDFPSLEDFCSRLEVLPYGAKAAQHYGSIRATLELSGQTIGVNDLHIAAHARSEGLTLVTNNLREFDRVEALRLDNWAV